MKNTIITHFTNAQHYPSILKDKVLRLEGHNIENIINQIDLGFISADKVVHQVDLTSILFGEICVVSIVW